MDGKQLEQAITRIESHLLPPGFAVHARHKEYGPSGVQLAEFDVVVEGRVGSAPVKMLIECRDRPSDGPAPGAWVEQLVGRRSRFGFSTVMAVSTTGFAAGAVEFAHASGILLRTVEVLSPEQMSVWFSVQSLTIVSRLIALDHARVFIDQAEPPERHEAFARAAAGKSGNDAFLLNPQKNACVTPVAAFMVAVSRRPHLWSEVNAGEPLAVSFQSVYPVEESYYLSTDAGLVRVPEIGFRGNLSINFRQVPFGDLAQYRDAIEDVPLAASAVASFVLDGNHFTLAFDRTVVDAKIRCSLRIESNGAQP